MNARAGKKTVAYAVRSRMGTTTPGSSSAHQIVHIDTSLVVSDDRALRHKEGD
jgi:hypothetical protein